MTTTSETYVRQLLTALRTREVPAARIAEVVAEVESHLAETGEDPVDAFGAPREYAAAVAGEDSRSFLGTVPAALLGGLTGGAVALTTFAVVERDDRVLGVPLAVAIVASLALTAATAVLAQRQYRPVLDPRTGRRRMMGGGWALVLLLAGAVVTLTLVASLLG